MATITAKAPGVKKALYVNTGNKAFGHVTGGARRQSNEIEKVTGIGGTFAKYGKLWIPEITVSGVATNDTKTFLTGFGLRSAYPAGLPPTIGTGVHAGDDTNSMQITADMKCDSWSLSCEAGEGAAAEFEITCRGTDGDPNAAAIGAVTLASSAPFVWGAGSLTIDAVAKKLKSISVEVDNMVKRAATGDTKAGNLKRISDVQWTEGEEVKVDIVTYASLALDLSGDAIDLDVDIVWTLNDGSNTLTVTLSGLSFDTDEADLDSGKEGEFSYSLVGEDSQAATIVLS